VFHPRPKLSAGKMGTLWNASLPGSGVKARILLGIFTALSPDEKEKRLSGSANSYALSRQTAV